MLKISAVYLIGNPENCQDPPSCGRDDLTLLMKKKSGFKKFDARPKWATLGPYSLLYTQFLKKIKYSWPIVLCRTLFNVPRPEREMQIKDHDSYFILTMDSKSCLKDMCSLIFRQFVHWYGVISEEKYILISSIVPAFSRTFSTIFIIQASTYTVL